MNFEIEQYISNFVASQFPQFYRDEQSTFILFLKAYYEWLESNTPLEDSSNNTILTSDGANTTPPIYAARQLFNYRDIDNTLEQFLDHFQKKYLYGIPFDVIINKRSLLKHILDVYRSKGSILCYNLLFKLIYDEDIKVYIPSYDMLKPSDGTWIEPSYIEISINSNFDLSEYIGQEIIGASSGATAIIEDYIKEYVNQNIVNTLYLSNINSQTGIFNVGETIKIKNSSNTFSATVLGSLGGLSTVINGGQNYKVGQFLTIPQYNPANNSQILNNGVGGLLKVASLSQNYGYMNYFILNNGSGITANSSGISNANIYTYFFDSGVGSSFQLGPLINSNTITYNTDVLVNYLNTEINSLTYNLPNDNAANLLSTIGTSLVYKTDIFGGLASITHIVNGLNYLLDPTVFVYSTISSLPLSGTISYNTGANTVIGTSTSFTTIFSPNSVIILTANSANTKTSESHVIKSVDSDTQITLYNAPKLNSTALAQYQVAPVILPANFTVNDPIMATPDDSIAGLNVNVQGYVASGNGVVATVQVVDSGRNYLDNQEIVAYGYNGVINPTILTGGYNYSNGDLLVFAGGDTTSIATGYVNTDSNGTIISTTLTFPGSGYNSIPNIAIQTKTGTGAVLTTSLSGISSEYSITGFAKKTGIGKKKGFWTTTRSFLNSDKYIQDSYFYQDYSYQIKAAVTLDSYKNIIYNTFHPAGAELFGEYRFKTIESSPFIILSDLQEIAPPSPYANLIFFTSDSIFATADMGVPVSILEAYINNTIPSNLILTSDSNTSSLTSDTTNYYVNELYIR